MRVMLINSVCKQGSTGNITYDLFRRIIADGNEAMVCYGRGDAIKEENVIKFGLDAETYLHAALARLTGRNACFSFFSTKRLIREIEKYKPDVVHIHELHAYFVNTTPLIKYLKKKKIKVIWTFHCEYMYTGKCGHAFECEGWLHGCGNCPAVRDYPKSLFFDGTKRMFAKKKELLADMDFTIASPSQWLADRTKRSFLGDKPIHVIRNGIDTDGVFYRRSAEEISRLKEAYGLADKRIVLAVAPDIMSERKGGAKVLEVSQALAGEKDLHFVMIGAQEDARPYDNVTVFRRTKNRDELALWYSAADMFLICSKRENLPTTCLEAFCCGTSVVGIDAGGTKETVPEPYGKFVENGTAELADAVLEMLGVPFDRDEISTVGRELYCKQKMYTEYKKLYEDIVDDSTAI